MCMCGKLVRACLYDSIWESLPDSDPLCFARDMRSYGHRLEVASVTSLPESQVEGAWFRHSAAGPVAVVSDGAALGHRLRFSGVLLDSEGLLGHFWVHLPVADPDSWAAEWLGRLLGALKAQELGARVALLLGDSLSTSVNAGVFKASPSHYINCVVRFLTRLIHSLSPLEGYVPSQHVTGWEGVVSDAQRRAHELASVSALEGLEPTMPSPSHLWPYSLLLQRECVCVTPQRVLRNRM